MVNPFATAKQKKTTKKKSSAHPVHIDSIERPIDEWLEAHKSKKNAEAKMGVTEDQILPLAGEERIKHSLSKGESISSVDVNGKVQVSFANRYSLVDSDNLEELQKLFGEDDAERFFKTKLQIALTEKALEDESILKKLAEAVGEENISKFFDVTEVVEVAKCFHDEWSTNSSLAQKAKRAIEEGLIKLRKGSIKPI